ncbi:ketopantoate reductase family protein [Streptomyces sp. MUM 203J]|uniref:ketopantoate reductase family protein n=1 Tax=Streptomyces sp. MUM 203J TaxID=2791990 RepID=UPI001F03BE07|nr:2-dehydropantoate 2-reductase [Streptomyces sp. MUM 203J]
MGETERLSVAVLGPGGVGGLLAGLLARAGHRVVCLAGEDTARALREQGIRVRSGQHGDFRVAVEAGTRLEESVDLVIVAVKETSLAEAVRRVPGDVLGGGSLVVPLLNGVEHLEFLRERYGSRRVAAGAIRVEATRVAPGVIEHGTAFTDVELAGPDALRGRLERLAGVLDAAGVTARVTGDEGAALWSKLALLAPFALLTTRYGLTIGEVRSLRRDELRAAVREVAAVGAAAGVPTDVEAIMGRYEAFPAAAKSSMQRDAEAGRPLELDAIGGAVVRAAGRHGVAVPVVAGLVEALR